MFISSFFDFLTFFIFLVHFFRRKSFFFSFFLYFLEIFLIAGVSIRVNCFLRSRCSMEMWCPDDIGRDSWDWVGPPAWGRACFNSPEWGGGSSPVKTEPPQIALFLLLFLLLLLNGYIILKRIIIVRWADLSDFFVDFRRKNVFFCFTSNENCHFSSEKRYHPKTGC